MKKPELKDYGLTEETIAKHRSEVNKYEHKKQVLEKENSRYNIQLIQENNYGKQKMVQGYGILPDMAQVI